MIKTYRNTAILFGSATKKKWVNDRSKNVNVENIGRKHTMYINATAITLPIKRIKQTKVHSQHFLQHVEQHDEQVQQHFLIYFSEKQTKGTIGKRAEIKLNRQVKIFSHQEQQFLQSSRHSLQHFLLHLILFSLRQHREYWKVNVSLIVLLLTFNRLLSFKLSIQVCISLEEKIMCKHCPRNM